MSVQSNDNDLRDLLFQVGNGKLQLPEFQRSWVWDDSKICKLIESVTMGFPMGALMFLETGGEVNYKPRLFTGVDSTYKDVEPEFLVLDGQQRLTTLYQVFMGKKPVKTCSTRDKEKIICQYYYLDINKALDEDADREDAIISISEDKTKKIDIGRTIELDLRTKEDEFKNMMFPLNLIFAYESQNWFLGMLDYYKDEQAKYSAIWQNFWNKIIQPMTVYKLPVIKVLKSTSQASVCQIFENVNRGGVPLNVFDLVTASLAADGVELRQEWKTIKEEFKGSNTSGLLSSVGGTDLLTSMTLWESYEQHKKNGTAVKCKKKDVLKLGSSSQIGNSSGFIFRTKKDGLKKAFIDAAHFLIHQGISTSSNVPYNTQYIPLAAIFAYDNNHQKVLSIKANLDKLSRWYWCGVFGELYGAANESRYASDIRDFFNWVEDDTNVPDTVSRSNFPATRLLSLQTRNSAAYKGIMALILREEPLDFATGQKMSIATYTSENTDIHHIFPASYCENQQLPRTKWNSIVNKTLIYATTNRSIGGAAPSKYIKKLFKSNSDAESLKGAVRSHQIDFDLLNEDRFDEFINDRAIKLLGLIEKATGKAVAGKDTKETIDAFGTRLDFNNGGNELI